MLNFKVVQYIRSYAEVLHAMNRYQDDHRTNVPVKVELMKTRMTFDSDGGNLSRHPSNTRWSDSEVISVDIIFMKIMKHRTPY